MFTLKNIIEEFMSPDKKRELWELKKELNLLEVNKENISTRDVLWQLPPTDLLLSKEGRKYEKGSGIEKTIANLFNKKECLYDKNGSPESSLYLKDIIDSDAFKLSKSNATIAIGQNDQGGIATGDLTQLQHLLVGGRCSNEVLGFINSTIISLLFKSTPDDVRIALIDTNSAGLNIYNEVPHLISKVETDPGKALAMLELLCSIAQQRSITYETWRESVIIYNEKKALNNKKDTAKCDSSQDILPKIVIIVTELADLMGKDSDRADSIINYLATTGKRTGMNLILCTQKPSIEVVTGLIKGFMPSRIAFKTDNSIDSRILLDKAGAEKLQVEGEMLYRPNGQEDVIKIQAARISQKEIDNVVGFWKTMRK